MIEADFTGGEKRIKAFEKMKCFLANPGMFCLVVLGSRGSGKHYSIEKAFQYLKESLEEEAQEELCLKEIKFIPSLEFPNDKKQLDKLFQSNISNTLVIEDFETLEDLQKLLLLDALSTVNGKFGITKKVDIRILFTSSEKIGSLRTVSDATSLLLWDRISQLVVEFPSFQEEGSHILIDFRNTWKKMAFHKLEKYKQLADYPGLSQLEYFLQNRNSEFVGGFRDLDKIACLYFNYRIFHYGEERKIDNAIEEKVFEDVKADFAGKTQMKEEDKTVNYLFDFNEVKPSDEKRKHPTLDDYNIQFRIQFRKWLLEKHHTLSKAADNLDCSIHTLKNYKEKKEAVAGEAPTKKKPSKK
jgi:hypothetical protein